MIVQCITPCTNKDLVAMLAMQTQVNILYSCKHTMLEVSEYSCHLSLQNILSFPTLSAINIQDHVIRVQTLPANRHIVC